MLVIVCGLVMEDSRDIEEMGTLLRGNEVGDVNDERRRGNEMHFVRRMGTGVVVFYERSLRGICGIDTSSAK